MEFLKKTITKKNWLFSLGLVAIFFLIFPQPVFGGLGDFGFGLVSTATGAYSLIGVVFALLILLTQGIAIAMGSFLNVVTSPGFVSLSYTNPSANPIIKIGLEITQSFVSMSLVIVLIFVSLSIALRWNETEAKKTFVRLIIVALLVNFAPVICGLIVDASNIVMNYFLKGIEKGVGGILSQFVDISGAGLWEKLVAMVSFKGQLFLLTKAAIQVILNLAVALAFLLFAVIFTLRYMAIWILVILSPLAFVSWILPVTKKYWDMWWEQLIQWSIIGIPLAFFLYLGMRVFEVLVHAYQGKLVGVDPILTGYFDQIFPYFVVLGFLLIGFILGLQTSAMGSKGIITGFQRGTKAMRKTAASKVWEGTKKRAGAVGAKTARIQRTYEVGRKLGLSRYKAAGESIKRYWQKRARPAMRPRAMRGRVVAAGRGILSATKDVALAGIRAGFEIKKGFRKCPTCGNAKVARSAAACPTCGHVF